MTRASRCIWVFFVLFSTLFAHLFTPPCISSVATTTIKKLQEVRKPFFSVNFLACVDEKYEAYLPLYAFCALALHANSVVEMVVPNVSSFQRTNEEAISSLRKTFGSSAVYIRSYAVPKHGMVANTLRFVEVPLIAANHTYIGDVDIILTEQVLPVHLQRIAAYGLPYSNVVRQNTTRLTGLHFVDTERYYTLKLRRAQAEVVLAKRFGNDEEELYWMCEKAHGMMPHFRKDDLYTYLRPDFGIHLSPNRWPLDPSSTMKLSIRPAKYSAFQKLALNTNMHSLLQVSPTSRNLIQAIHRLGNHSKE